VGDGAGCFLNQLSVKDIEASRSFYEKFIFKAIDPDGKPVLVDQHV